MTSGIDIVTNDAGEFVRAAHARDSGEDVLVSLHRLAQMVRVHDSDNQAFVRQLEQTHKAVLFYCLHAGRDLVVLFADRVVLIGGQVLRGSRAAYEAANELGERLMWCGGAELTIQKDVSQKDLRAFAESLAVAMRSKRSEEFKSPTAKIRLRPVSENVRVRGLNVERLSYEQKLVRTYASAVVVMRRFFETMRAGRFVLPRRLKRIAQNLVDLSSGRAASFLGVTEVRNANHDDAGRAVNSAILAVAAARQLTSDRAVLSQLAMAALLFDVGRPRAEARVPKGIVAARLSEQDEDRMPAGAAVVLTALGRMNEPTIARTVLSFEALWLKRAASLGKLYGGELEPTLQARLVALARRYNDLLTPEPGLAPPTPDFAVGTIAGECRDDIEKSALRMLVAALGITPAGTLVKLTTGETAEVIATAERSTAERPRVRVVLDARGAVVRSPRVLDLAAPQKGGAGRDIAAVVSTDGWKQAAAQLKAEADAEVAGDYDDEEDAAERQEPHVAEREPASLDSGVGEVPSTSLPFSIGWRGTAPPSAAAGQSPVSSPAPARGPESRTPSPSPRAAPPAFDPQPSQGPYSQRVPPPPFEPPPAQGARSQRVAPAPYEPPAAVSESQDDDYGEHTVYEPSPFGAAAAEPELDDTEHTQYFRGGVASLRAGAIADAMNPPIEPSATGNLKGTPLPNVLVYVLDRALTGTMILRAPDGAAHAMYFDGGAPTKLRMGHPVAPLSEELLAARLTLPQMIEACESAATQQGLPLADFLRRQKLVPEEGLADALRKQLHHRVEWLVKLPEETTYAFYQGYDALEQGPSDGVGECEPLDVILAANRVWRNHARIISTLTKLGEHPIVLHPEADLAGLSLTHDEQSLLDIMRSKPCTMAELYNQYTVSDKVVSTLLYTLLITRQFLLPSQPRPPMRPRRAIVRNTVPARPGARQAPDADISPYPPPPRDLTPPPADIVARSSRAATVPEVPPGAQNGAREVGDAVASQASQHVQGMSAADAARSALGLAPSSPRPMAARSAEVVVHVPTPSYPAVTQAESTAGEDDVEFEHDDVDSRQSYPSFASFQSFGSGPASGSPVSGARIVDSGQADAGASEPSAGGAPERARLVGKPAAKGDLATTPMVHILVYLLDHVASGTVLLVEPDRTEHLIAFRDGVPTRIKTGRPVELLGALLVEGGLIGRDAVDEALREAAAMEAPLGEYLVLQEAIKRQQLEVVLQVQMLRKFAALANLPPETTYAFYRDIHALDQWGGKSPVRVEPLQVMLETVRAWYDRHRIRGTLYRMKDRTLVLRDDANAAGLKGDPSAAAVIGAIEAGGTNILSLYRKRVADEEDVNSVVYTLAVTRQFTFASEKGPPMGGGPRSA